MSGRITFRRNHGLSEDALSVLQKNFPAVDFEFGGGDTHPHPVSATERALMEDLALKDIRRDLGKSVVVDIGGSTVRHSNAGRDYIHCCNPLLDGNDVVRRARDVGSFCKHRVQDCDCVTPDVYLSIHSLYYLSPTDIAFLVNRSKKKALYAVLHVYDDMYGGMHWDGKSYESKYTYFAEGNQLKIAMNVNGNLNSYVHDSMAWIKNSYMETRFGAIAWNGRKKGDSWLLKFVPAPSGLTKNLNPKMCLVDSINRADHYGHVKGTLTLDDRDALKPSLEVLGLMDTEVMSFGPFFWVNGGGEAKMALVPKDLIRMVALKMVGVERNRDAFKKCLAYMKQAVSNHKMSIPSEMKLDCVTYGTALAFVYSLKDEIMAFNSLSTWHSKWSYSALKKVLDLEGLWEVNGLRIAGCAIFGVSIAVASTIVRRPRFNAQKLPLGFTLPLLGLTAMGMVKFFNGGEPDSGYTPSNLSAEAYKFDRSSEPGSPAWTAAEQFPLGLPGVETVNELSETQSAATISRMEREEAEERGQFYIVAPGFQECIPVVPYASANNEVVAVNNRCLMKVPMANPKSWAAMAPRVNALIERLTPHVSLKDEETAFHEWNDRFPKSRRVNQLQAWETLQLDGLDAVDFTSKAFVKRELTLKPGAENEFDPRLIQGSTDKCNVALGPYMLQFSEVLSTVWNKDNKIFYTSHANAEEIGCWRDQFGDMDVTILEIDQTRYDAHQGENCFYLESVVYNACGLKEYDYAEKAFRSQSKTKGYTSKGVKYSIDYRRKSGQPNTSCGNSLINGLTTSEILENLGFNDYRMLVMGDDNLIVLRGHLSVEQMALLEHGMKRGFLELGFKAKVKLSMYWHEVEYCSSLFWPTKDGTVLGPKLGRRLPKLGFSMRKLKPGEVKGMFLGIRKECKHVPIIRDYAQFCLKQLASVERLDYDDVRRKYKSLPSGSHLMCAETKEFFEMRYGVSYDSVHDSFNQWLSTIVKLDTVASWPPLEVFLDIDV